MKMSELTVKLTEEVSQLITELAVSMETTPEGAITRLVLGYRSMHTVMFAENEPTQVEVKAVANYSVMIGDTLIEANNSRMLLINVVKYLNPKLVYLELVKNGKDNIKGSIVKTHDVYDQPEYHKEVECDGRTWFVYMHGSSEFINAKIKELCEMMNVECAF